MLPIVEAKISTEEFQITDWATQIAELQAQIARSQSRINRLNEDNAVADGLLQAAQEAKGKISDQEVIADLLAQLSQMLGGDNNSDDGNGNHPNPEPQPGDDGGSEVVVEAEQDSSALVAIAVETTEALTGQSSEWASPLATPFASPLATPLCCQMEDAPQSVLQGQSVEIACVVSDAPQKPEYIELVPVSHEVAYQRRNHDGEIICCYVGFNNKTKAKQWGEFLAVHHSVAAGFQLRASERLTAFKYEIKLWGLSFKQIERCAECDLQKSPPSNFCTAPKRKVESEILEAVDQLTGSDDVLTTDWKLQAKSLEVRLDNISPGHYLAYHQYRKLKEVVQKHDADSPYYVNRNQRTMLSVGNGDGQKYDTPHEAAIGLAKFLKVIKNAEESKADLFGGGYDVPVAQPQPAPDVQKIEPNDWVELLVNGDRYQVAEVDGEGIHLATNDGNMLAQPDEVKLLMKIPATWQPF